MNFKQCDENVVSIDFHGGVNDLNVSANAE